MKTVLVRYEKFVGGGHPLQEGGFQTFGKVVTVLDLQDLNKMFDNKIVSIEIINNL